MGCANGRPHDDPASRTRARFRTTGDQAVTRMVELDAAAVAAALPAEAGESTEATPDEWMTCLARPAVP